MNRPPINKTSVAGWIVAAGLLGIVFGSGFQGAEKYGVVDLRRVILDSKLNKQTTDKVEAARKIRVEILRFINEQRVISASQAARLRELELKETKTDAEKTELDQLKAAVTAAAKELDALITKTNPSEAERLRLIELNRLDQESQGILQQYTAEFEQDFERLKADEQNKAIDAAAAATVAVAKSKGFTVVYSSSAVVYAANDLTADATKEANK